MDLILWSQVDGDLSSSELENYQTFAYQLYAFISVFDELKYDEMKTFGCCSILISPPFLEFSKFSFLFARNIFRPLLYSQLRNLKVN